jgi:hypothetical protein
MSAPAERPARSIPDRILDVVGSLRLTVALLGMSIFLVFAGTLAQRFQGIGTVLKQYFRCGIAWIDFKIFYPEAHPVGGGFWFPGGFLIGSILVANLLVSHARRIRVQARGQKLLLGLAVIAIGSLLTWMTISHVFDADSSEKKMDPFWRVTFQLLQGVGVAGVLFFGCQMLFGRKAGIVLLHGGVLLMMSSELLTHYGAEEANLTVSEGESRNYAEDIRVSELAFIDSSGAESDRVVAVPEDLLRHTGPVVLPELPFDLDIAPGGFLRNAKLASLKPGEPSPATRGEGMSVGATPLAEATMDALDFPAAYVTLKAKGSGAPLGTWLFGVGLDAQRVDVGGKGYDALMRFKRVYKPYEIHLIDFSATFYPGTQKPKDFSAFVRLVDPARGTDREVRIWMNNPLRYRGDTLYQSSWDGTVGTTTTLQVVSNSGWMVPYVGCMIVAVGLFGQFSLHLLGFLRSRRDAS